MISFKVLLPSCFAISLFLIELSFAQPVVQINPSYSGKNLAMTKLLGDPTIYSNADTTVLNVGFNPVTLQEYRFAYQWTLPVDSIPFGTQITGASLTIDFDTAASCNMFFFYKVGYPLEVQYDSLIWSQLNGYTTYIGSAFSTYTSVTESFGSSSSFVDSLRACITDSTHDNYFRLGVKRWNDDTAHIHVINPSDVHLTIQCILPGDSVVITNVIHNVEHYAKEMSYVRGDTNVWLPDGQVSHNDLPDFARPPVTKYWCYARNHLAETWMYRFDSTADGWQEKYHDWNRGEWDYCVLKWVTNFDKTQPRTYRNYGKDLYHAELNASIELYYPKDSIPFEFQDPWRAVQNKSNWYQTLGYQPNTGHLTPYIPWADTTTFGVFLGQNWSYNMPYYSIRPWRYLEHKSWHGYEKKCGLPLNEGDGIFLGEIARAGDGWRFNSSSAVSLRDVSDSNDQYRQTDIRFNSDSSVTTMLYKAHLLSDLDETFPTQRCNQRKIDVDDNHVYHMVYESAGEIWYTQSLDGGATWSPEELVSDMHTGLTRPNPGAVNPSLAVQDSCVYVVYNDGGKIWFRLRNKGTWEDPVDNPIDSSGMGSSATPVIDVGRGCADSVTHLVDNMVLIVYDGVNSMQYSAFCLRHANDSVKHEINDLLADQIDDQPRFPSVANLSGNMEFGVAWRDGQTIRYSKVTINNCNVWWTGVTPVELASNDDEICVFAPSLTRDKAMCSTLAYETMYHIWTDPQSGTPYYRRGINIRTRNLYGWETTDYLIPSKLYYSLTAYVDPFNPTIGAYYTDEPCDTLTSRGLRLSYHKEYGGGTRLVQIDCDPLFDEQCSDASYPNMTAYAPSSAELRQVSSYQHASPLNKAVRCTDQGLTKGIRISTHLQKELRVYDGKHTATHAITDPRIVAPDASEEPLEWRAAHDTLTIGINTTVEAKTRTEAFTVQQGSSLRFDRMLYARQSNGFPVSMHLKLQLRDAATDAVLHERPVQAGSIACDTSIWSVETVPLSALAGRTIYACMSVAGASTGAKTHVTNVLLEDDQLPRLSRTLYSSSQPNGYELLQNTPNPFARTTDIMFRVPDNSYIRLTVSDLLGREIAVPANGIYEAGYHNVTFNASSLPAGTYLYTLQAPGVTVTKRMTLTK